MTIWNKKGIYWVSQCVECGKIQSIVYILWVFSPHFFGHDMIFLFFCHLVGKPVLRKGPWVSQSPALRPCVDRQWQHKKKSGPGLEISLILKSQQRRMMYVYTHCFDSKPTLNLTGILDTIVNIYVKKLDDDILPELQRKRSEWKDQSSWLISLHHIGVLPSSPSSSPFCTFFPFTQMKT